MRLIFHIHFFVAKMIEIGIKQLSIFMHVFMQIKVQKMPRILQLRPRISAMSASRFFFYFLAAFFSGVWNVCKKILNSIN